MKKTIKTCCFLSDVAYRDIEHIKTALKDKFSAIEWINNEETDTQVLLCRDNDTVFVVPRGTEFYNWNDWKTNFDCDLVHGPFGKVHEGFYTDVLSVLMPITQALIKDRIAGRDIVVTGHSQGAALGVIFSAIMHSYGNPVDYCVPIGCPRCMDFGAAFDFGAHFGHKIYTLVNNNDIVCRIPTRAMGFKHVYGTNLYYFDENGDLHHDISYWHRFLDRIQGVCGDFGEIGLDCLKDHYPSEYVRLTENF